MTQIYLVDYLGVHCGMHYYLEAFRNVLSDVPNTNVNILSNYPNVGKEKPFFINQYRGNKLTKGIAFLKNLLKLKRFIKRHPKGIYIYLTYGNFIDLPFMKIVSQAQRHLIDIHEAIAQNVDANERLKHKFRQLYQARIRAVISHSTRTNDFLNEYGYKAKRFSVPHFKYVFPKDYNFANTSKDILDAINTERINLLFFGNLNESKGVDILLESINLLEANIADKLNIIIAGKDFDGAVDRIVPKTGRSVRIIRRHITDDELRYLYQNVDYLSLPYRKTSQSGILEMAFYFKRPIIASDIPYFRQMLTKFPSFGVLAGNTADSYSKMLKEVVKKHGETTYYTPTDYNKYENRSEIKTFISDFIMWLNIK